MDDSCAVCAESLEWVAYGACGHREVCSTCVARLRFICNDRRCCICKTENDVVFVTKALGDYTRMINDFSVLPSELREGKVGPYWYHEDTQAFFDDVDHYKMIKAMCRLSCSVCDNVDEQSNDGPRRPRKFRNIEQLRGHLFHQHKLIMCSLCLEGRKVFICEQKLYTRAQLNQHIHTGDSEVDGSESERGGFSGHPSCEFCRNPFYGENELYTHMSTDHYTCHICQRQHPGQYEYFKNYDDLENHFRRDHFLCEDEACLGKKFIVFQSEPELKKHNTIEHAGRMSRAQRNAVLQIPTSFIYRRSNEDNHRGRGRGRGGGRERGLTFRPEPSDYQLSRAIEASLVETGGEPSSSSSRPVVSDHGDTSIVDSMVQPFESLSTSDSEPPSRYLNAAAHNSRGVPMEESSFPPLAPASSSSQQSIKPSSLKAVTQSSRRVPIEETYFPPLSAAPNTSQQSAKPSSGVLPTSTMASQLRRPKNTNVPNSGQARNVNGGNSGQARNVNVLNSGQAWPAVTGRLVQPPSNPVQFRPTTPSPSHGASSVAPSYASSASKKAPSATVNGGWISSGSSSASTGNNTSRISNSASAPTLAGNQPSITSVTDFPPVSATQVRKLPSTSSSSKSTSTANVEYVHTANKSLVEKIQAALEYDEDKYTAFKDISGQYRQGLIDTGTYLDYVKQYNLSHLLLDLARPLPDPQKQRELIETYNASMRSNGSEDEVGWHGNSRLKDDNGARKGKGKGKGKSVAVEDGSSKETLADSIISNVQKLQSNYKPSEEETEVLSKDGYRGSRDKSKILSYEQPVEMKTGSKNDSSSTGGKQRKKTSKFDRVRLGDGSVEATFDPKNPNPEPEPLDHRIDSNQNGGLPVRGVWKSKGGQKLFP